MGGIFPSNIIGGGIGPAGGYWNKIYNTETANLIGFWRQNELSGSVAKDWSPQGNDGEYTGVTLANAAGPDGVLVPFYDGSNDYLNIYSAGFNTDFDGSEGTALVWARVNSASVWTDGAAYFVLKIAVGGDDAISLFKTTTNNRLEWRYRANGTLRSRTRDSVSEIGWMCLALTWSATADEVRYYYAGEPEGGVSTTLGAWSGALSNVLTNIGTSNASGPNLVWHGWIGPVAIWKTPLTPAQVAYVSTV